MSANCALLEAHAYALRFQWPCSDVLKSHRGVWSSNSAVELTVCAGKRAQY